MVGAPPAGNDSKIWAIALDGGTTNTRARLMHGRETVTVARRTVGVRDVVQGDPSRIPVQAVGSASPPPHMPHSPVAQAVREVLEGVGYRGWSPVLSTEAGACGEVEFIVAAGMLSSEVGLVAVPHITAPAGLDDLARGVTVCRLSEIAEIPIYFVPGIRTPPADGVDGWFQADVMRGEECETWGAYSVLLSRGEIQAGQWQVFLWPGSHAKLVELDPDGRITRSQTSLAGEMLQAIAQHTLLAASLPGVLPDEIDEDAARAAARAVERDGLGRAAFLVRIAALARSLNPVERASFWIGAVIADDVINLARHSILAAGRPVWVGGRRPLRGLYAAWLSQRHRGMVVSLDDDLAESASAFGALEIATRRRHFDRSRGQSD